MDSIAVFATLYGVVALCFVVPPPAFRQAGLTVETLFEAHLGSRLRDFVAYQSRRTIITVASHTCLLAGFMLGMLNFAYSGQLHWHPVYINALLTASTVVLLACGLVLLYLRYVWQDLRRHWIFKTLSVYDPENTVRIVREIDAEVQNNEDDLIPVGTQPLYITQSWILKPTTYSMSVAHQRDVDLVVTSSVDIRDPQIPAIAVTAGTELVQLLFIKVTSIRLGKPFFIRIFAGDFRRVQQRLDHEIRNAQSVIVRQSTDDQFITYMREHVRQNNDRAGLVPVRQSDADEDRCMGCMSVPANIRLRRGCDGREHGCSPCFCRPMWCLDCFGRWFLSRQDLTRPDSWSSGHCECPTCHARFCLNDIVAISPDAFVEQQL